MDFCFISGDARESCNAFHESNTEHCSLFAHKFDNPWRYQAGQLFVDESVSFKNHLNFNCIMIS